MIRKERFFLLADSGSSLISTLFILVFLSVIVTSVTGVVKHQVLQYRQTAYSYEAKALIEMTTVLIQETDSSNQSYPDKVDFNLGTVTITKIGSSRFMLEAVLTNQYTSRKEISIPKDSLNIKEEDKDRSSHTLEEEGPLNGSDVLTE